jgi:hypothetical protein
MTFTALCQAMMSQVDPKSGRALSIVIRYIFWPSNVTYIARVWAKHIALSYQT